MYQIIINILLSLGIIYFTFMAIDILIYTIKKAPKRSTFLTLNWQVGMLCGIAVLTYFATKFGWF